MMVIKSGRPLAALSRKCTETAYLTVHRKAGCYLDSLQGVGVTPALSFLESGGSET